MSDDSNTIRPPMTTKAAADADERQRRLAEALRVNLQRRKAQTRARAGKPGSPQSGIPEVQEGGRREETSSD